MGEFNWYAFRDFCSKHGKFFKTDSDAGSVLITIGSSRLLIPNGHGDGESRVLILDDITDINTFEDVFEYVFKSDPILITGTYMKIYSYDCIQSDELPLYTPEVILSGSYNIYVKEGYVVFKKNLSQDSLIMQWLNEKTDGSHENARSAVINMHAAGSSLDELIRFCCANEDEVRYFGVILEDYANKHNKNHYSILLDSVYDGDIDKDSEYIWLNDGVVYSDNRVEYDKSDIEIIYNEIKLYVKRNNLEIFKSLPSLYRLLAK